MTWAARFREAFGCRRFKHVVLAPPPPPLELQLHAIQSPHHATITVTENDEDDTGCTDLLSPIEVESSSSSESSSSASV
jgi:hypothetical protein